MVIPHLHMAEVMHHSRKRLPIAIGIGHWHSGRRMGCACDVEGASAMFLLDGSLENQMRRRYWSSNPSANEQSFVMLSESE